MMMMMMMMNLPQPTEKFLKEKETCLEFFHSWTEQDQIDFVEDLLQGMCHYQARTSGSIQHIDIPHDKLHLYLLYSYMHCHYDSPLFTILIKRVISRNVA